MIIAIIILIVIVVVFIALYVHDPKFIWKIQQWFKWRDLQPHIENINTIHCRVTTEKSTKNVFKNIQKNIQYGDDKKKLAGNKSAYVQYIDFCKNRGLDIPTDYEHMMSVIEETENLLDPKKALDRELERASKK